MKQSTGLLKFILLALSLHNSVYATPALNGLPLAIIIRFTPQQIASQLKPAPPAVAPAPADVDQHVPASGHEQQNSKPAPASTQQQKALSEAYPYALASYLSYRFKPTSDDAEIHNALQARLKQAQFSNATEKEVPADWVVSGEYQTQSGANRIYDHKDSGLKGRVLINHRQKKIILAFTGTEFDSPAAIGNALLIHGGYGYGYLAQFTSLITRFSYAPYEAPMLRKALFYAMDLFYHYPGYQISLAGSSLGGAIAQFVALSLNLKACVFNSLALGDAIYSQLKIAHPSVRPAEELITHYYVEGEFLNDAFLNSMLHIPYLHGSMPVKGNRLSVPDNIPSLHGYDQGWLRHHAKGMLTVFEAHMAADMEIHLPKLH